MAVSRSIRRTLVAASLAASSTGVVLAAVGPAEAATDWYVAPTGSNSATCQSASAPCATVTGALAKAAAGDTIDVAPGTYTDQPYLQKAVNVVGTGSGVVFKGTTSATNGYAMAVAVSGTVDLSDLTLTGGHYASGGALPIVAGNVATTDVDVTNSAAANGGGIYVYTGSLTMTRGSVTGNTATATAANQGWGGGIYENTGTTVSLDGTTVSGNTADGAGKALGLG
ncbi:MAG: DUF1565 domain-containing protein, partial [Nocardioidaceae bacterium]|nr:DUF1565 domain-containing protein [Nocardioidaceae bacterium]